MEQTLGKIIQVCNTCAAEKRLHHTSCKESCAYAQIDAHRLIYLLLDYTNHFFVLVLFCTSSELQSIRKIHVPVVQYKKICTHIKFSRISFPSSPWPWTWYSHHWWKKPPDDKEEHTAITNCRSLRSNRMEHDRNLDDGRVVVCAHHNSWSRELKGN